MVTGADGQPKNSSACPKRSELLTIAPEKSPVSKSNDTTSSRATQQRSPSGPNRRPLGWRKGIEPSGLKILTSRPLVLSYSRTLEMASGAPKGHSQDTTMLPLGAMARSSGLSCESSIERGARRSPSASNTLMVFSPMPEGLIPDAKKTRPSGAHATPLGNGTTSGGRDGTAGA